MEATPSGASGRPVRQLVDWWQESLVVGYVTNLLPCTVVKIVQAQPSRL